MSKVDDAALEGLETLKPQETRRIVKNVVVISVAFMVHFTAYGGAANLQSSINAEAGLGTASLVAVYAGFIFSNMFLPVPVIKWLGTKWSMSVSILMYMPYIAAQLYPRFYTLIPAGIVVGLGAGPLWCSKDTYIAVASAAHSKISKIPLEPVLVRFMGLSTMIFQTSQIWGNLISSVVLSSGNNAGALTAVNESMIPVLCGANFLPSADIGGSLPSQPSEKIQVIAGIYLACMAVAAIIVAVKVDPMTRYDSERQSGGGATGLALLAVTFKLLVEPNSLLLVVHFVFTGLQVAFFGADFTAAFVSCAVGTGSVGFVMMASGLANFIACAVTGYVAKFIGRLPLMVGSSLVYAALFFTLLAWRPQAGEDYVLYVIAVVWGLVNAVWTVQISAYCAILFHGREEAAFSNFSLWKSIGYIIAYLMSPLLRTSSKVYVMLVLLAAAMAGYLAVEYRETKKSVEEKDEGARSDQGCDNSGFSDVDFFCI